MALITWLEYKKKSSPNYSIDQFLNKAELSQKELEKDKDQADRLEKELDQKIKDAEPEQDDKKKYYTRADFIKKKVDKPEDNDVESDSEDKKQSPDSQNEWESLCGDLI